MATKKTARKSAKKTATKKATKKRAYTRRTPVDDKPKRKYNRKPKPEQAETIPMTDTAAEQPNLDKVEIAGYSETQSNASVLREIQVIDLRGANTVERFTVLAMLDKEGYLTEQLKSPLDHDQFQSHLFTDAIGLNHNNKIISPAEWTNASRSAQISRPQVRWKSFIGFTKPDAAYEDTLQVGNATYIRVG